MTEQNRRAVILIPYDPSEADNLHDYVLDCVLADGFRGQIGIVEGPFPMADDFRKLTDKDVEAAHESQLAWEIEQAEQAQRDAEAVHEALICPKR